MNDQEKPEVDVIDEEDETKDDVIVYGGGKEVTELEFQTEEALKTEIDKIDRRNRFIETVTKMALSKLQPQDFHDFDGKPLLQGVGAQRLIKYFGISVSQPQRIPKSGYETVDVGGAFVLRVTYRATFVLGKMAIEGEGMRDTRNKFFCKSGDDFKEIIDIELPNLDRAARTAMYRDGVSTLLGLKGLNWEYLKSLGFTRDKTTGHTYKTGSKGGDAADSEKAKELKTRIGKMILAMADQDKKTAEDILERLTEWESKDGKKHAGKRNLKDLTDKQTPVIYGKVEKAYDEWLKDQGIATESEQEEIPL